MDFIGLFVPALGYGVVIPLGVWIMIAALICGVKDRYHGVSIRTDALKLRKFPLFLLGAIWVALGVAVRTDHFGPASTLVTYLFIGAPTTYSLITMADEVEDWDDF